MTTFAKRCSDLCLSSLALLPGEHITSVTGGLTLAAGADGENLTVDNVRSNHGWR